MIEVDIEGEAWVETTILIEEEIIFAVLAVVVIMVVTVSPAATIQLNKNWEKTVTLLTVAA